MVDRIAEIREALAVMDIHLAGDPESVLTPLVAAARAYADLLESDALIIRRDEDGEWGWPEWAMEAASVACRQHMDGRSERHEASDLRASVMLDALASSEGVEP